jgi:ribonuclease HI
MKDTFCKNCGSTLITKQTQRKPSQLTQPYYYTAYYFCPNCQKIYHDEAFKVINTSQETFFAQNILVQQDTSERNIWTDGACTHNGSAKAKAAWAFVSGEYEESGPVEGKQTNNTAEAYAIYHALKWAAHRGDKAVRIHTDSQITIHGLQKPVHKIKQNREIFEKIQGIITAYNLHVSYEKVPGHAGDVNNERADRLANTLAGVSSSH